MIVKMLPLIIALALVFFLYKSYQTTPKDQKKPFLIKYAVYVVIAVLLLAVVTGRIHWLGAVLAGALGLLKFGASTMMRFLPFLRFFRRNNVFGDPKFQTRFLKVQIFMASGAIQGTVIAGEFSGRDISSLSDDELDRLESQVRNVDNRSYYLLKVIRQRLRGTHSSEDFSKAAVDDPSLNEAEQILGLNKDYTKKDVEMAYKRLMQKLHPDRGGNDYLASRVNCAREILIKNLEKK